MIQTIRKKTFKIILIIMAVFIIVFFYHSYKDNIKEKNLDKREQKITNSEMLMLQNYQRKGIKVGCVLRIENADNHFRIIDDYEQLWKNEFKKFFNIDAEVICYSSGQKAKQALKKNEIDLLLGKVSQEEKNQYSYSKPIVKSIFFIGYREQEKKKISIYENTTFELKDQIIYIDKKINKYIRIDELGIGSKVIEYDDITKIIDEVLENQGVILVDNSNISQIYPYDLSIKRTDLNLQSNDLRLIGNKDIQPFLQLTEPMLEIYREKLNEYIEKIFLSQQMEYLDKVLNFNDEISQKKKINVKILNYMYPYVYKEKDTHQIAGLAIEWLNKFAQLINMPIDYIDYTIQGRNIKQREIQENEIYLNYKWIGIEEYLDLEGIYPLYEEGILIIKEKTLLDEPLFNKIGIVGNNNSKKPPIKNLNYEYIWYKTLDDALDALEKKEIIGLLGTQSTYYYLLMQGEDNLYIGTKTPFQYNMNMFYTKSNSLLGDYLQQVSEKNINALGLDIKWREYFSELARWKQVNYLNHYIESKHTSNQTTLFLILSVVFLIIGVFYYFNIKKINRKLMHNKNILRILEKNMQKMFILINLETNTIKYISPNINTIIDEEIIKKVFRQYRKYRMIEYIDELAFIGEEQIQLLNRSLKKSEVEQNVKINLTGFSKVDNKGKWVGLEISSLPNRYRLITLQDITLQIENNRVLEESVRKAQAAEQAKSRFLANMSHEIRTPINAIMGLTEIGLKNANKKGCFICIERLAKVERVSEYLLGIINDILDMEKIENNRLELQEQILNVKELVEDVSEMINQKTQLKHQTFLTQIDIEDQLWINADGVRIKQVMINLLSNASKFTHEEGKITWTFSTHCIDDNHIKIQFAVADTGIGILEQDQERIFSYFERGNRSKGENYEGTGLGLAICKSIIGAMDGEIVVESEIGKGSIFRGFIVVKRGDQSQVNEIIECDDSTKLTSKRLKHILLVDDVELNRLIITEFLVGQPYAIEQCENGKECLDKLEASPAGYYHMIFMDIQMPIMDGYVATECIRNSSHPDAKTIPIIAMSANAFKEDMEKAQDMGMNDYLCKPIYLKNLIEIIEKY